MRTQCVRGIELLFTRMAFPTLLVAVSRRLTFFIPKPPWGNGFAIFGHMFGMVSSVGAGNRWARFPRSPPRRIADGPPLARSPRSLSPGLDSAGDRTIHLFRGECRIQHDDIVEGTRWSRRCRGAERLTALVKRFGSPADHMYGSL